MLIYSRRLFHNNSNASLSIGVSIEERVRKGKQRKISRISIFMAHSIIPTVKASTLVTLAINARLRKLLNGSFMIRIGIHFMGAEM